MQYAKTIILSLVCLALLYAIGSCKKESKAKPVGARGRVINLGPVPADGCGWVIFIDSTVYHPDNLPEALQSDSILVKLNYTLLTTRFQCSMNPNNTMPVIHLNTIEQDFVYGD